MSEETMSRERVLELLSGLRNKLLGHSLIDAVVLDYATDMLRGDAPLIEACETLAIHVADTPRWHLGLIWKDSAVWTGEVNDGDAMPISEIIIAAAAEVKAKNEAAIIVAAAKLDAEGDTADE